MNANTRRVAYWIERYLYVAKTKMSDAIRDTKTFKDEGIISSDNIAKLERMYGDLTDIYEELTKSMNENE